MKDVIKWIVLGTVLAFTGCMHNATHTSPATLAPGAADATDANANQTLQTLHAFAAGLSTSIQNGTLSLTATQRSAVDTMNKVLNTADLAEQTYHTCMTTGSAPVSSTCLTASGLTAALTAATTTFASTQTSLLGQ